jgi:hypothetical protein
MAYCQSVEHNPNYYQNSSSRTHHPSLNFYLVRLSQHVKPDPWPSLDPGLDTSQSFKLFQNKNVKKRLKRKKCEGQKSFHDLPKKITNEKRTINEKDQTGTKNDLYFNNLRIWRPIICTYIHTIRKILIYNPN